MKKLKSYQLARRYAQDKQNKSASHEEGPSLPFSIRHIQSSSDNLYNIFKNNQQLRIRKLQMSKENDYTILGLNQFDIYNRRKEKKRNDVKEKSRNYFSCLSSGSEKNTKYYPLNPMFLTKEEVMLKNSTPSLKVKLNKTVDQINLCSLNQSNSEQCLQSSWLSSVQKTQLQGSSCFKDKFSLSRLKEKMNNYKKTWEKYLPKEKEVKKSNPILRKVGRSSKNHLGLNKLTKFQKKIFHLSFDEKQNTEWDKTLRQNDKMQDSKGKEIVEFNGISLSGTSKLKKEEDWLQKKHNEGFFFSKKTFIQH